MKIDTDKFRATIKKLGSNRFLVGSTAPEQLQIYPEDGIMDPSGLSVYYAPFDGINMNAKVVLLGITPGLAQMLRACGAGAAALERGNDWASALSEMKRQSSFKDDRDQMRPNLFRQFEHWGVTEWLGISKASMLFGSAWDLVHTTSVVRYPTFKNGSNYVGQSPKILKHPFLRSIVMSLLADELNQMPEAVIFTFGPKVDEVIQYLSKTQKIKNSVVSGMLHPSGNNTYRLNYLCGDRAGEVPSKTNVEAYDRGRNSFRNRFLKVGT